MYVPRRYEEKNQEKIFSFISKHNFGIVISVLDNKPIATHIPLLPEKKEDKWILTGHISKGNEQKTSLQENAEVLVVFPGPHAYISPSWYTQMNVPTWNYISVHLYGKIQLLDDTGLRQSLEKLMKFHESSQPHPTTMKDIPDKILQDDLRGIVGFAIMVSEIQAAYKLSQNRDAPSYHNVISKLNQSGAENAKQVAAAMEERVKENPNKLNNDEP
jgi:transcriptional regulator